MLADVDLSICQQISAASIARYTLLLFLKTPSSCTLEGSFYYYYLLDRSKEDFAYNNNYELVFSSFFRNWWL